MPTPFHTHGLVALVDVEALDEEELDDEDELLLDEEELLELDELAVAVDVLPDPPPHAANTLDRLKLTPPSIIIARRREVPSGLLSDVVFRFSILDPRSNQSEAELGRDYGNSISSFISDAIQKVLMRLFLFLIITLGQRALKNSNQNCGFAALYTL